MKVKCIKIYNDIKKQYQDTSSWLTIGKEYIVLAIEIRLDRVLFLISSDYNDQPTLQEANQFEVISKKISSNWEIFSGSFQLITLEPKKWHEPGFWDDYYNGEISALEVYKKEAQTIMDEEIKINFD